MRDVRTGAASNPLDLPDSTIGGAVPLPNGWAWIPKGGNSVVVMRDGQRREIPKPAWSQGMFGIDASPDGSQLLFLGWGTSTSDSLRVEVVPVDGRTAVPWVTTFAESGNRRMAGGRVHPLQGVDGRDAVDLLRVRGPGQVERLGTVPHPAGAVSVSADLQRATMGWRDYRGDAWLYRVVKP